MRPYKTTKLTGKLETPKKPGRNSTSSQLPARAKRKGAAGPGLAEDLEE